MRSKNLKYGLILVVLMVLGFSVGHISAAGFNAINGSLDSPGPPANTKSFSLEAIYQRLEIGANGAQKSYTEPPAGPTSGTMHTLNQVMAKAPVRNNVNGAQKGHVLSGKKFWGLTAGQWGLITGARGLAPIPKTGQIVSQATGDDGDLEKGVAHANPRFTDNNNGTVTDNSTGLVWLEDAYCWTKSNWSTSLDTVELLNSGECDLSDGSGEGDWRMPNLIELLSLIDYGENSPALPSGHPFDLVKLDDYYWTSTTDATFTGGKWCIHLNTGESSSDLHSGTNYIWPVRDKK